MATNSNDDDDNMGFILHPDYRYLQKLTKPIVVTGEWFNRKLYSIRLKEHSASSKFNRFRIFTAGYDIRLHLQNVPPEFVLKALKFCFHEIFYIIAHNTYVEAGTQYVRVVFKSDCLKGGSLNLRHIGLDKNGAQMLLDEIERTVQSKDSLLTDENLELIFCSSKITQLPP
jgi:hypothetical protein